MARLRVGNGGQRLTGEHAVAGEKRGATAAGWQGGRAVIFATSAHVVLIGAPQGSTVAREGRLAIPLGGGMNNARESDRAEDAGGVGQPNDPRPSGGDVGLCQEVGALARWNACRRTARQRFSDWFLGAPPTPVSSFRGLVEGPDPDAVGICCSGGGIRSAAFNLGALQALDKHQELRGARYLAAVSGGSYIAAVFTMVAKAWTGKVRPKKDPKHPYNGYHDSNPDLLADPEARPFAP